MPIFAIVSLLLLALFLLGWIYPLSLGIVRTRKGNRSVGLIVFGSIWGGSAVLLGGLIGFAIFVSIQFSSNYETQKFNPAEHEGATASIILSHKGEATFSARDDLNDKNYQFSTSNGVITVPAVTLTPQSYNLIGRDDKGSKWNISGWLYGRDKQTSLDMSENQSVELAIGPPLVAEVTRSDKKNGTQRLDLAFTDVNGNKCTLRAPKPLMIEIVDEKDSVLWTHKLEYG